MIKPVLIVAILATTLFSSPSIFAEDYFEGLSGDSDSDRVAPAFPSTPTTIPSSPTIGDSQGTSLADDLPEASLRPSPLRSLTQWWSSFNTVITGDTTAIGEDRTPWLMDIMIRRNRARPPSEER